MGLYAVHGGHFVHRRRDWIPSFAGVQPIRDFGGMACKNQGHWRRCAFAVARNQIIVATHGMVDFRGVAVGAREAFVRH